MPAILFILAFLLGCNQPTKTQFVDREIPIPQLPIENPPPVEPGKPGFLRFDEIEQYTDRDIKTLNATDRLNTRYLHGCNFLDQGISDLSGHRAGVNKGLNMISQERLITQADTIDEAGCIWRINIHDIGMTTEEWRRFENANVLPFISESVRGRTLRALTNSNQPLVYASAFFLTVMQADQVSIANNLYYDLTEQPQNDKDFLTTLGINLQQEFNESTPACAGGGRSQIALGKPRLICILDTADDGFLLVTFDVSLAANDSIAENPFLPEMAKIFDPIGSNLPGTLTKKIFKFVASEWIYSLPNGLMTGYRLSAGGNAQVIAPTNVVIDIEQAGKKLPPDITLGACSNCHHQEAAIFFKDEVFDQVRRNGNFNAREKQLAEVFYRADRFQAKRSVANTTHARALKEIGVNTLDKDPLVGNIIQPLRGELNADKIAGYLQMEVPEFKVRLAGTNLSKVLMGTLIDGGVIPLQDFVRGFPTLVNELNLFRDEGQL